MVEEHPRIWFERAIDEDLRDEVEAVATLLSPPDAAKDPFDAIAAADGVMAGSLTYDASLMDRVPNLRVICRTGIGYDQVDLVAATERGIAVCNTPDGPTVSTAEHAVALILAAAKRLKRSERWLHEGESNVYARHEALELDGKTLGLVGYGRIPRRVAAAGHALGMGVIAYDPHLAVTTFANAERVATLEALLGAADVVSVHVPMTPETAGMFSAEQFGQMKRGSIFVNTARGGVVDQVALLAALDSGHLMAAGLDVTDPEPLPGNHPLLRRDDVVVTPHVASGTYDSKRRTFRMAFHQVIEVLSGRRPEHLLNPEVWRG